MEAALVCAAKNEIRFACDSLCGRCSHLIGDRRRRGANLHRFRERRRNYVMPLRSLSLSPGRSLSLSPGGAALPEAGAVTRWAPGVLPLLIAALLVSFNLLDALLTWRALSLGATEANPLMSGVFNLGPAAAVLMKSLLVAAGAFFLWRLWHLPLARRGMMALTACYGAVVAYHLVFQFIVL